MSEVLRAIMDHNCVDSRPAFYSARSTLVTTGTGFTMGTRQAQIPCKADTFFLVMGATMDEGNIEVPSPYRWAAKAFPNAFEIVRGSTRQSYYSSPQPAVLQNYNLNNFASFDEYILFEPAELIIVNMFMRTNTGGGLIWTVNAFVTLVGVEYQMPAGRGVPAHG